MNPRLLTNESDHEKDLEIELKVDVAEIDMRIAGEPQDLRLYHEEEYLAALEEEDVILWIEVPQDLVGDHPHVRHQGEDQEVHEDLQIDEVVMIVQDRLVAIVNSKLANQQSILILYLLKWSK